MQTRTKKSGRTNRSNREKGRSGYRGPMYWVTVGAMGALVAYTPYGIRTLSVEANAREPVVSHQVLHSMYSAPQSPILKFDIQSGTVGAAVDAFQQVTGLRVLIPNGRVRDLTSPGVLGMYTAEQAMKQLLAGTGVIHRFTSADALTLELPGPAESVEVTGQVENISSLKYTEPLRDIPQTITVIPKSVIEEQGATTLRDVLRNVPGLTMTAGEGGTPAGDNLTLRGFSARNDVFVDGVRDLGPQSRDPFNLEQVEVTKGPASAYSGRGSTGGSINMVSKSPGLAPLYGFSLNLGTDKTRRLTGDLNVPLEQAGFGKRSALRLNFLAHDSGVAGRDVVENKRWGLAPSLALGLGTPSRLTLSYFKLNQDNLSDYGIPWVPATNNALAAFRNKPAPVPRDTFYGFKSRDFEKLNSDLATVKFEHDFSDTVSLRNQLRYGRSTRDSIATPPRFASDNSTVINRELRSWLTEDSVWDNQTDLKAQFGTGAVQHSLVTGIDAARESNVRQTRTAGNATTTLLNPNPNDVFTLPITLSPIVGDITGNSLAAYAFDTVKLGQKFELNGGLRYDYFDVKGVSTTNLEVARIDRMLSWRAGAVYKPKRHGSIYAAYGTSLNPSLEGLSYNTANTAIEPEKTYTFEFGTKWDLFHERLSLTGAGFRVNKTNARTPGLTLDDPAQVLQGEQRVYGAELSVTGNITRDWKVFAAYTYLASKILKSNTPAEIGRELINTPKNSSNVWTTYRVGKLNLGGGARYVDERYGNTINTRLVGDYWLIDAMASYSVTEHIDLRFNLFNLADKFYFDRLGGGHVIPGPGRSANASIGFRF
jgi:catecholate siderophore receptor